MSTGCVANFCVPDLCSIFTDINDCEDVKDGPASLNKFYSTIYMAGLQIPTLIDGVTGAVESTVSSGLFKIFFVWSFPFIFTLIILIIILIRNRTITFDIGILLSILVIVLFVITIFWILNQGIGIVTDSFNEAKDIINQNWITNKDQITCNISQAFNNPDAVTCLKDIDKDKYLLDKSDLSGKQNTESHEMTLGDDKYLLDKSDLSGDTQRLLEKYRLLGVEDKKSCNTCNK